MIEAKINLAQSRFQNLGCAHAEVKTKQENRNIHFLLDLCHISQAVRMSQLSSTLCFCQAYREIIKMPSWSIIR